MDETVNDIFDGVKSSYKFDLLLEIIPEGQTFQVYAPGSLNAKIFMVDVDARELHLPVSIRMPFSSSVQDLKLSMKCKFILYTPYLFLLFLTITGNFFVFSYDEHCRGSRSYPPGHHTLLK